MSVASSVTSSAVSSVCLVRAVERSPSARPPAKSRSAGGPGGEGGGGAMPGTSAPRGSWRLGVAAQEESPRPGRDEGRGERGRGEGGSPSLVQSLSLVSREMLGSWVQRKDWWPWGVRTATMSVWGRGVRRVLPSCHAQYFVRHSFSEVNIVVSREWSMSCLYPAPASQQGVASRFWICQLATPRCMV